MFPRRFRRPQFAHRGFEPDVGVLVAIHPAGGEQRHRFHRKSVRRHARDFVRDGRVFADGCAPLHAFVRPVARNFQAAFRQADARGGQRQPAGVERRQRDAQTFAFGEQNIFARHADVRETDDAVVERPQAHEMAAVHDFDARPVHFHDERRDLVLRFAVDDLSAASSP